MSFILFSNIFSASWFKSISQIQLTLQEEAPSDLLNGSFLGNMPSPFRLKELMNNVQQRSARHYTAVIRKPRNNNSDDTPLFSSDEEC